jgi:hypothetical protein
MDAVAHSSHECCHGLVWVACTTSLSVAILHGWNRGSKIKGDVGVGGCLALGGSSVLPPPIRDVGRRSMAMGDAKLG